MHFAQTYTRLLESLPSDLQKNTVQYSQLKRIIHQVVEELSSLGLSPVLLRKVLNAREGHSVTSLESRNAHNLSSSPSCDIRLSDNSSISSHVSPKVLYEFNKASSKIEPHLRISPELLEQLGDLLHLSTGGKLHLYIAENNEPIVNLDNDELKVTDDSGSEDIDTPTPRGATFPREIQKLDLEKLQVTIKPDRHSNNHEVIVPLVSDSQFFDLLYTGLEQMSTHLKSVEAEFTKTLRTLADSIGKSTHPASSYHPILRRDLHVLSPLRDNACKIKVPSAHLSQSDLYTWREIFQAYVEAEIFESVHEQDRGERSIEESERRLKLFAEHVTQRGLVAHGKLKLKTSRRALETFLQLNFSILNIKKFQLANSEATRKILKKHAKQTALPLPTDLSSRHTPLQLTLIPRTFSHSLPRILVQAIGETLLPILPQLDDYSCLICISIAFKPIRLDCGHLFCVRCLVKMQKRGKDNCPMCRSPCVLAADKSNVDWALMNFMQDWFPIEAREKLKANEKEATAEALVEQDTEQCLIM